MYLDSLKQPGPCYLLEETQEGFALVRRSAEHVRAFNDLARETIRRSGVDYVALPRTDGHAGYDQVFVIPLD